jgi:hypothetical protein
LSTIRKAATSSTGPACARALENRSAGEASRPVAVEADQDGTGPLFASEDGLRPDHADRRKQEEHRREGDAERDRGRAVEQVPQPGTVNPVPLADLGADHLVAR